ncbi:G5 domain-containing protein [Mycoplasmatota bacterium]|nr:G5 domain-containing protein [Mycoplasmatota bacterium]
MEKTKRWIKSNLLFFISIVTLMISIIFSALIFYNFRIQASDFNTRVAHIYLGNDDSQYESILLNAYDDFSKEAEYTIIYQNHSFAIDLSYFEIATDEIIEVLVINQNNHAYFNISNEDALIADLTAVFGEDIVNQLSTNFLFNAISNQLSVFNYYVTFNLDNYFSESYRESHLIEKSYDISDENILNELPQEMIVDITGNSTFSLLEAFSEYQLSNDALSYLASAILDLSLESHFKYYQFYEANTTPTWLETDIAVQILENNHFDLVFTNIYCHDYRIQISIDDSTLNIVLIGSPYINNFELTKETIIVPYTSIYEEDLTLTDPLYQVKDDETETIYEKVETPGENGQVIQYIRTITYSDDTQSTYEIFLTQISEPINQVILQNIIEKAGD